MSPTPNAATAAEQLRRLLLVLPTLADDQVHSLDEIATRIDSDVETVRRDLFSLINRDGDEPGGRLAVPRADVQGDRGRCT